MAKYQTVQDDGTPETQRPILNVIDFVPGDSPTATTFENRDQIKEMATFSAGMFGCTGTNLVVRTIVAGAGMVVTNGDGASGNPTINYSTSLANFFATTAFVAVLNKTGADTWSYALTNTTGYVLTCDSGGAMVAIKQSAADQCLYSSDGTSTIWGLPKWLKEYSQRGDTTSISVTSADLAPKQVTGMTLSTNGLSGPYEVYLSYESTATLDARFYVQTNHASVSPGYFSIQGSDTGAVNPQPINVTGDFTNYCLVDGAGAGVRRKLCMRGWINGDGSTNHTLSVWFWYNVSAAGSVITYPQDGAFIRFLPIG